MMATAHNDPDAITFCKTPRLLPQFQDSNSDARAWCKRA